MRVRGYRVSADLLAHLMTEGRETHARCKVGIPPGAKFVCLVPHPSVRGEVLLVMGHPSFADVREGGQAPLQEAVFADIGGMAQRPLALSSNPTSGIPQ